MPRGKHLTKAKDFAELAEQALEGVTENRPTLQTILPRPAPAPCCTQPRFVGQRVTMPALAEALRRDATELLEAYRAGMWVPTLEEREFAESLAQGAWDALFF